MNNKNQTTLFLLRIGVALAFIYPAVAAFFDPFSWIGFFPSFLRDLFSGHETLLLHTFGITEVVIGLWILIGKKIFIPSLFASVYLALIVLLNLSLLDIVFRDISIFAMALALTLSEYKTNQTNPIE
ncbi:MAG TPA: hypothetical protein VJH21_01245 [Candidatus Paceibacterota bacterium]